MGLLVECPQCKRRNSLKAKTCKCGLALGKLAGKSYWISFYDANKQLRREKVGPNKGAAEQRLRECLSAKAEGRFVKKSQDSSTLFKVLAAWYLNLPEVQAKRSYKRDRVTMKQLLAYFGNKLLQQITPGAVEAYRQKRLAEPSGRSPKNLVKPASVNRETACLRTMFNRAIRHGKAEKNPCQGIKLLRENNKRDRILSPEEYTRLLDACPAHIRDIIRLAYHTGMRAGEITSLTWERVDLQAGFLHLLAKNTKTDTARSVPLNPEMLAMLRAMPRGLPGVRVFTYLGKPIKSIIRSFKTACRNAGIVDFTFHDFRHTFNTNAYNAGVPIPTIMKITGHKSVSMFLRYTTITPEDLQSAIAKLG